MAYIFMDESGDLGFDFSKPRCSRYFVISFLVTATDSICKHLVAKTVKTLSSKERQKFSGVFHCYKERDNVRCNLLNFLENEENVYVLSITLDKKSFLTSNNNVVPDISVLYNNICTILLDKLDKHQIIKQCENKIFIASQRETNKYLNKCFIETFSKYKIDIKIGRPSCYKGLQIVDFISWSIFHQYEYESAKYSNLFRNKIIEDFVVKKI